MSVTSSIASLPAADGVLAVPPLLAHAEYLTQDAFLADRRTLFERCWLFAGLADDLMADGRITVAGAEVALRHEGATWHGSCDGRAIAVESCGNLVFVSLAAQPEPLERHLHPFSPLLRTISSGLGVSDRRGHRAVAANWKILVENAIDDYHAATVHPRTLYPSMLKGGRRLTRLTREGPHSLWQNELSDDDQLFWEKARRRLGLAAYAEESDYRHLFLFPNFYLSSFCATLVMLHRVEPLAPGRARLDWWLCLPRVAGSAPARDRLRRVLVEDLARQAEQVIGEDAAVCELAQKGHRFAVHAGLLGRREHRVLDFQQAILAARR